MVPLICIMYGSLAIVWSAPTTANNLVGQDCEGSYIGGTDCISSLAEQLSLHSELTPGSRMKRERGKTTTAMPEDDDLLSDKFRMPTLSSIAKKPPVDIEFEDISYSAGVRDQKAILFNVSGYFSSGHLTAIIGPSGAGKSTLMDILTGQKCMGVSGTVKINQRLRDMAIFRKMSCYVMQEDLLQPNLTLFEAISVSASLKLGPSISSNDKKTIVDEILKALNLTQKYHTFTNKLSGGERKRFSIALELVDNPSVIFLDEPTTGLDQTASTQCIQLLKKLAKQGRTIICSIHQPSALIFKLFDQVYVMSRGKCAYHGTTQNIVPFLASVGFICPLSFNPADYIIEILQESSEERINELIDIGKNGKQINENIDFPSSSAIQNTRPNSDGRNRDTSEMKVLSTPFCTQFYILFKRMIKQSLRNKLMLLFLFAAYFTGGLLTGIVFYQTGYKGDHPLAHLNFLSTSLIMAVYCQVLAPTLLFPVEFDMVKREYCNGWYSVNAYYTAAMCARLPVMHGMTIFFVLLSYFLSGQPTEWERFMWYYFLFWLISVVSESYGLLVGSIFRPQMGAVVGPCIIAPIIAVWQYNMGAYQSTSLFMKIIMNMSFFRLGMVGMFVASMKDRQPLDCDALYCPFRYPRELLKMVGAEDQTILLQVLGLLGMLLVYRLILYLIIRLQLSSEFYYPFINYIYKKIKQ